MFDNIIKKIKMIATIFFILGVFLAGLIIIAAFMVDALALILVGIVIFFTFWMSAILIYGFGEIIDKLDCIASSPNDFINNRKSN